MKIGLLLMLLGFASIIPIFKEKTLGLSLKSAVIVSLFIIGIGLIQYGLAETGILPFR
jgi:hypothetical protein